jgi:putative peptidase
LGQTATKHSRLFYNFLREKWLYPELRYKDFEDVRKELLQQQGKETTLLRMLHRSPEHLLNQKIDEWAGHILPFVTTEPDSVELNQMKLDDIAEFYHRLYGATKQTTIIVTGTFDAKEELKHITAAFSQIPEAKPSFETTTSWTSPSQAAESWLKLPDNTNEKTDLLHIERLWSGQYEPGLRQSLILKLMRDALRQRVIQIVREKEGLVYSPYVSLFYDASPWSHFLMDVSLTAAPHQRKKIQEILTRIEKDLQQVPLSDAELTQLKRPFLIAKNDELAPDDASAWRTAIERLIKNRESLEDFNRYEEILESIRPEDVQRGFQTLVQQRHWLFLAE